MIVKKNSNTNYRLWRKLIIDFCETIGKWFEIVFKGQLDRSENFLSHEKDGHEQKSL